MTNMAADSVVVASRLHWTNHARHEPIDTEKALGQVRTFYERASSYGDAVVLALGLPAQSSTDDAFTRSVSDLVQTIREEIEAPSAQQPHDGSAPRAPFRLVPMTFWGQFVPALNAIISTAATEFPSATRLLFQSLEIQVSVSGVAQMRRQFLGGVDLVVGAALPGHAFSPEKPQPLALDGVTSPWNTLALWDLQQLSKIGFPLVGDGLGLPTGTAGVEEVSTIALYQQLFPDRSNAKVVQVPGLEWHVQSFDDEERRAWQQRKMESKKARPALQLQHLELPPGRVFHIEA